MKKIIFILIIYISFILLHQSIYAQWLNLDFPAEQGVSCLAYYGEYIYAGVSSTYTLTNFASIYRSNDYGSSWNEINKGLDFIDVWSQIKSIIITDSIIYEGHTGTDYRSRSGVYYSSDNGEEWFGAGLDKYYVYEINSLAALGSIIYTGGSNGIYLTPDKGKSWSKKNNGLTDSNIVELATCDNTIFAVTKDSGLFVSNNYTDEWKQSMKGYYNYYNNDITIGVSSNTIYTGLGQTLLSSTDYGNTWKNIHIFNEFKIISIAATGNYIFVMGNGYLNVAYLSSDNGISWNPILQIDHDSRFDLMFLSKSFIFISGYDNSTRKNFLKRRQLSDFGIMDVQDKIKETNESEIHPNPADDFIDILNLSVDNNIRIYNVMGEIVICHSKSNSGKERIRIDISSLFPGFYFVQIGNKINEFIKLKK